MKGISPLKGSHYQKSLCAPENNALNCKKKNTRKARCSKSNRKLSLFFSHLSLVLWRLFELGMQISDETKMDFEQKVCTAGLNARDTNVETIAKRL